MKSFLYDDDYINRRRYELAGLAMGVCNIRDGGAPAGDCWCYGMGNPSFPCPGKPDEACIEEQPDFHLPGLTPIPWNGGVVK